MYERRIKRGGPLAEPPALSNVRGMQRVEMQKTAEGVAMAVSPGSAGRLAGIRLLRELPSDVLHALEKRCLLRRYGANDASQ